MISYAPIRRLPGLLLGDQQQRDPAPKRVAESDTTSSAPSMTIDGAVINIAAEGLSNSLDFYWAVNGSGTWNPEQVAPPGTMG